MSKGFFIDVEGLPALLKNLDRFSDKLRETVAFEIADTAKKIERKAARRAPVDTGRLRGSISAQQINGFNWQVVAQVKYAPYVEFGTGGLVEVPKGLEDYAIQFKGANKRKVNLPPRPFMFPSYFEEKRELIKRLKEELKAR